MIDAHRRRLGHAECAGGQDPAVTGNYPSVAINENRDDETENLDALGDLPDLLLLYRRGFAGSSVSWSIARWTIEMRGARLVAS